MSGTTFVDTSAIYALLVKDDAHHDEARLIIGQLESEGAMLVTSSFVAHECIALFQARLGVDAVRTFYDAFLPMFEVHWVDDAVFHRAASALLAARSRNVTLTDWTSFEIMQARGLEHAFAFDEHFVERGFKVLRTT